MKVIGRLIRYVRVLVLTLVTMGVYAPRSEAWKTGAEGTPDAGWVLDDAGRRFFAVGLWGVPGYTAVRGEDPPGAIGVFRDRTAPFNLIISQSGYQKPAQRRPGLVFATGLTEFRWALSEKGYTGPVALPRDTDPRNDGQVTFDRMQALRSNLPALESWIDRTVVRAVSEEFIGYPFIHFIMDEPETGGQGWFWPPELIALYHRLAHARDPGALTFVDFGGDPSANRLFYERRFGRVFRAGTDPATGACDPGNLDTYNYAIDGASRFIWRPSALLRPGGWERRPLSEFAPLWYTSIRETARAYASSADVFGMNAYAVFRDYPETAGETVDAIRAGAGPATPVWLFFDGSAYQKPTTQSYDDYLRLVTCQVWTSIIHGATGALFYSYPAPGPATDTYWEGIRYLAEELSDREGILALPVRQAVWDKRYHTPGFSHLHYSIRGPDSNGRSWLIAANTSHGESLRITVPGFDAVTIEPLGVRILSSIAGKR